MGIKLFSSQIVTAMKIVTGFGSQIFLAMEIATGFLEIPSRNSSQKNSAIEKTNHVLNLAVITQM